MSQIVIRVIRTSTLGRRLGPSIVLPTSGSTRNHPVFGGVARLIKSPARDQVKSTPPLAIVRF